MSDYYDSDHYDVIIVGSGVAGALCAWGLSQSGRQRILILEAGDNGITAAQHVLFHHVMDTQGNRGDMYAPYKNLESRFFAPAPESAQLELEEQKSGGGEVLRLQPEQQACVQGWLQSHGGREYMVVARQLSAVHPE